MEASNDSRVDILRRPIPFLERAENAYAHIRETMFTASDEETRDNIRAVRTMLARSEAVIVSREGTMREIEANDGQRVSGGA
jgi:hypothetical protein